MLCESALEKLELAGLLELPRTISEQHVVPTANLKQDLKAACETYCNKDCVVYLYDDYCFDEEVDGIINRFLFSLHEVLFHTKDCVFDRYQNIINNYYYLPDYRIIVYGDAVDSDRYDDPPDVCHIQLGIVIPSTCDIERIPDNCVFNVIFDDLNKIEDGKISRQIRRRPPDRELPGF